LDFRRDLLDLDLGSARARLDVVAEHGADLPQRIDAGAEVVDVQHDPVPSAGRLLSAVRQRAGTRAPWTAEDEAKRTASHRGERGPALVFELEAEMLRVEPDRTIDIGVLIPNRAVGLGAGRVCVTHTTSEDEDDEENREMRVMTGIAAHCVLP
jgi:hypothetical protein